MMKALHVSLTIVTLTVGCAHAQVHTSCDDTHSRQDVSLHSAGDETSLLQLATAVRNRNSAVRLSAPPLSTQALDNSSAPGDPVLVPNFNIQHPFGLFQRLITASREHARAWQLHIVPQSQHVIGNHSSLHSLPWEASSGWSTFWYSRRSDQQVLVVCVIAIVLLVAGWSTFWLLTRRGAEWRGLRVALLFASFGIASWGMNVVNKSLVEALHSPTLVTAAQMSMTAISSVLLSRGRFRGSWEEVLKWLPVPLIFFGILFTSFLTYEYLTLSMIMVVRNLGPLIVLPVEALAMPADKRPLISWQMVCALLILLASTCIYRHTIEVSLKGLIFAIFNLVLSVGDRTAQRRLLTTECRGLSPESCLLLNNLLGLIPTLILAHFLGDFNRVDWQLWFASSNSVLLLLSGIIGSIICYSALAVQREVAATSFMVLQNVIRMNVVGVGVLIFHDPIGFPHQVLGLAFSFIGALWYGKSLIDGKAQKSPVPEGLANRAKRPKGTTNHVFAPSSKYSS